MSKIRVFKNSNKYYYRMFVAITLSILITLFSVSSVLYLLFENMDLELINTYISHNLSRVSYSTTFLMDWAKTLSIQIYNDRDIRNILYSNSPEEIDKSIAFSTLDSYRNTAPHIHSIYIYNGVSKEIYYDSYNKNSFNVQDFFDTDFLELIDNRQRDNHLIPIPRKVISDPSCQPRNTYNVYTFVFYDNPARYFEEDNVIAINIHEDWMKNVISSLDYSESSSTFIIDNKGRNLISKKGVKMLEDLSDKDYIKRILLSGKNSGYFLSNVNGVKSLISYNSPSYESVDWKYISVVPFNVVTYKIEIMKKYTLLTGLIILMIGLATAYYASLKLYKPIDKLLSDLKKLQNDRKGSINTLKQEMLRNLLRTGSQYHEEELKSRIKDFEIKLDTTGYYLQIVFKIDNYTRFCKKFIQSDRNLFRFATINITDEILSVNYICECVDMESDHIVAVLYTPDDTFFMEEEKLTEAIKNIQHSVNKYLSISLSAIVSSVEKGKINNVSVIYSQLLDTANYRLYMGHGCIIFNKHIDYEEFNKYDYPMHKEKSLINALMLKRKQKAKSIFKDIIVETQQYVYSTLNITILRITLAINAAVENIERVTGINIDYNFNKFISTINKLETIDDIFNHFNNMFDIITSQTVLKKNTNHDELVSDIVGMIEKQYPDANLNIDIIAKKHNMSPVYLGRVFKQNTLKSVAEYINEVRIDKAKSLLESTDSTVNDIAQTIGFSNTNYFYTLFKKLNGITPAEYRELNK